MDDCPLCERTGGEHWPSCKLSEETEEARRDSIRRTGEALADRYIEVIKTEELVLWSCKTCAAVLADREVHRDHHRRIARDIESSGHGSSGMGFPR